MKRRTTRIPLLLGGVALLAFFGSAATAADVNKLIESCADCHGKDGVSTDSDVPTIAGMSETYLADSMTAYKNKERPCPETKYRSGSKKDQKTTMCEVAKNVSDADAKAVAKALAGKKFVRAKQKFDAGLAKKGKAIHEDSCEKCHTDGGSVADDDAGILAGQQRGYLEQTFAQYSAGKRPMPNKMKPKMEKLNKGDIEALVHYYASFQ